MLYLFIAKSNAQKIFKKILDFYLIHVYILFKSMNAKSALKK